jgi:uridine phosphorylase
MKTRPRGHEELPIAESELIVTPAGAIYHLNLRPEQIAGDIIVVGDQNRVKQISRHFDHIEFQVENREFITHTGTWKGKRITALSTGIGTDNIDIVLNELDALVNIDLTTRKIREKTSSLNIVRLGTSGSLQEDIPVDAFVVSSHAIGFDGVMGFYEFEHSDEERSLLEAFCTHSSWPKNLNPPYFVKGSDALLKKIGTNMISGITATANGFYGPQGRMLRLRTAFPSMNEKLGTFRHNNLRICNYEMETSSLYGLGSLMNHNTATVCAIIANRYKREYSKDYHKTIDQLIEVVLHRLLS